jgi:hypothetical protein
LQTDGIEHAGGGLTETRGWGAFDGFAGKPLGYEAAKAVQINQMGELDAVAECSTGSKNGIPQAQGANLYAEIDSVRGTHFDKSLPRSGRYALNALLTERFR